MHDTQSVYQAIQFINHLDEGKITKANLYQIVNKTGLSEIQVLTALKQLYADKRITAEPINSTGKNDYGEIIDFSDIVAIL